MQNMTYNLAKSWKPFSTIEIFIVLYCTVEISRSGHHPELILQYRPYPRGGGNDKCVRSPGWFSNRLPASMGGHLMGSPLDQVYILLCFDFVLQWGLEKIFFILSWDQKSHPGSFPTLSFLSWLSAPPSGKEGTSIVQKQGCIVLLLAHPHSPQCSAL